MTEYMKATKLDKILESIARPKNVESIDRSRCSAEKIREDICGLRNDQLKSQELVKRIEKKILKRKSQIPKNFKSSVRHSHQALPTCRPLDVIDELFASFHREAVLDRPLLRHGVLE